MIPNIVNQLGGGSGIDTQTLVQQLVELQQAPDRQRLDRRETKLETQISDYGRLRSALGEFETAVSALGNPDTFNAKSVSVPDTDLVGFNKLDPAAAAGSYELEIEEVARAQSLSSGLYASADAEIGTGSLTIRFGDWNSALDTFSLNEDKDGATIEIDESNNTLGGLRDAINAADIGVQATVVNAGGGYRLQLTAPSGATNEIELVATEDAGSPGLAGFNFSEAQQSLSQQRAGQDAELRINGLLVTRETNTIDDVIEGLEFDIFKASPGETIALSITQDKAAAETAIRDFVDAYNTFKEEMGRLTGYDPEIEDFGSLRNDSMASNLMSQIRGQLGSAIPGLNGDFSLLATIGIRTEIDGTLSLDAIEDEDGVANSATSFRAAIDNNFEQVRDLFVPKYESDNTKVQVTGYGSRTQAGSYDVQITQNATKGELVADPVTFPLDTTGKDYSFTMNVDGQEVSVSLPDGVVYNSGVELATELQSLINLDETLQEAGIKVNVNFDGGSNALAFQSDSYGSGSKVNISAVGADAAELGLSVANGTEGLDVEGTVDGEAAFGFGNVLLPAIGSPAEGLKMITKPDATSATINFSRGFAGGLTSIIDTFLANNGLISERESNIEDNLERVEEDRSDLQRRTEAYRARLESQFLAMEQIVRSLNNTGTFLDGLADRLPFTASSD